MLLWSNAFDWSEQIHTRERQAIIEDLIVKQGEEEDKLHPIRVDGRPLEPMSITRIDQVNLHHEAV